MAHTKTSWQTEGLPLAKRVRLIVCDVDGTLVNSDKQITEATVKAVHQALAAGVTVAVASGRAWGEMAQVRERLPEIHTFICSNGAIVMKQDGEGFETVFHQSFSAEHGVALLRRLLTWDVYGEAYAGDVVYGDKKCLPRITDYVHPRILPLMAPSRKMVADLPSFLEANRLDLEKIQVFYGTQANKEAIVAELGHSEAFTLIESSEGNLEFVQPGVNKGKAVAALADSMGLGADEVMTIGDSNNDLTMLTYADVSFAMGNGEDTAKAAAAYETLTNDEDGVAVAILAVLRANERLS